MEQLISRQWLWKFAAALQNQEILQCQVLKCFPGYCFLQGKVEASKLHPHTATSRQSKRKSCCFISFGKHCASCAPPEQTAWKRAGATWLPEERQPRADLLHRKQSSWKFPPELVEGASCPHVLPGPCHPLHAVAVVNAFPFLLPGLPGFGRKGWGNIQKLLLPWGMWGCI